MGGVQNKRTQLAFQIVLPIVVGASHMHQMRTCEQPATSNQWPGGISSFLVQWIMDGQKHHQWASVSGRRKPWLSPYEPSHDHLPIYRLDTHLADGGRDMGEWGGRGL